MKQCFVDFENVGSKRLSQIKFEGDEIVHLFYTDSAKQIDMDTINYILESGAEIKTYHVGNGMKNALDFQLATMLGFIIAGNEVDEFVIISEDQGFDKVVEFWKEKQNIRIKRMFINTNPNSIHDPNGIPGISNSKDVDKFITTVSDKDLTGLDLSGISFSRLITICNTSFSKEEIHNKIEKACKNSHKSSYIYHQIKPILIKKGYV